MSTHPELEASVLLALPLVTLETPTASTSGTLTVSVLTHAPFSLSSSASDPTDATPPTGLSYLILHLNAFELPIDPSRPIICTLSSTGSRAYTLYCLTPPSDHADLSSSDAIRLHVPAPSADDPRVLEDLNMLDAIFAEYTQFHTEPRAQQQVGHDASAFGTLEGAGSKGTERDDLRGRLVLMDETSGEVVGELLQDLRMTEDAALARDGDSTGGSGEKPTAGPVVLELPPEVYDAYVGSTGAQRGVAGEAVDIGALAAAREIFVRAVLPEDQDWITRSASFISWAIDSSTSVLLSGITTASTFYINHSTPSPYASSSSASSAPRTPDSREDSSALLSAAQPTPSSSPAPVPLPLPLQILSSPRTHAALSSAQVFSRQAMRLSHRTAGFIDDLLSRVVSGVSTQQTSTSTSNAATRPDGEKADAPPPPYDAGASQVGSQRGEKPLLPPSRTHTPQPEKLEPRTQANQMPAAEQQLPTRDRLALSANLVLASVDDSARRVWEVGSERLAAVVEHKYGPAAAHSTTLAAHTARNVALVYIDMSDSRAARWISEIHEDHTNAFSSLLVDPLRTSGYWTRCHDSVDLLRYLRKAGQGHRAMHLPHPSGNMQRPPSAIQDVLPRNKGNGRPVSTANDAFQDGGDQYMATEADYMKPLSAVPSHLRRAPHHRPLPILTSAIMDLPTPSAGSSDVSMLTPV
ncbi:hypothetical protein SCP_0411420 [Sparassis crispa]|uniref:Senescence domain-containing protein n=1 Tax=Sparassis crispa TaxID=139825 RepID=A0A401GKQ8_9APHY|nr:hypothetical protein SCP_0411420 [Sparassis crispa]GBE82757.1 hypothetical protein SCP_0411420 [Sparassis crispa]